MTAIQLDEGHGGVGAPVLKRKRIGERFAGMLAYIEQRDHRNMAGETVRKADGKAMREEVLTLVALPGSTMVAGIGKDDPGHAPEPGEVVRLIVAKGGYAAWIEAKRALGRGAVVGDVVTLEITQCAVYMTPGKESARYTQAAQVEAHLSNNRGGSLSFSGPITARAATDDETFTWLPAATAAHHDAKARKAGAPADVSAYGADYGDDAPF